MGTCSNCKYWSQEETNRYDHTKGTNQGKCTVIGYECGVTVCQDKLPDDQLAQIQSTYDVTHSELITRGTFGCVLHELKVD